MITEIKIIHDTHNGVIKLKVNGELARSVWAYGEDTAKQRQYILEAKEAAFNECCLQSVISGAVHVSELSV